MGRLSSRSGRKHGHFSALNPQDPASRWKTDHYRGDPTVLRQVMNRHSDRPGQACNSAGSVRKHRAFFWSYVWKVTCGRIQRKRGKKLELCRFLDRFNRSTFSEYSENKKSVVLLGQMTFWVYRWRLCGCFGACRVELHDG